jgi:hypothetical protein
MTPHLLRERNRRGQSRSSPLRNWDAIEARAYRCQGSSRHYLASKLTEFSLHSDRVLNRTWWVRLRRSFFSSAQLTLYPLFTWRAECSPR